jgi:RimJ/RimL family protein N-acetyltransferase
VGSLRVIRPAAPHVNIATQDGDAGGVRHGERSGDLEGQREVTYWVGREDWGRGIATRALQEFLQLEATRPLYARAASDNAASIRVLTRCGFLLVGEGRAFGDGRNEETDEVVLRLDA